MNSFINRSFSRREKLLMLFLVLILLAGLYFYLVHYPITSRLEEIDEETDEVLFQTDIANTRLGLYNDMKSELDEIFAMPEDQITVMPEYDNIQTLMNMFNVIFAGTQQNLSFDEVKINDNNVAERTVRFSFNADSYDHARQILSALTGTGYRCLMNSLSFSPVASQGQEKSNVENSGLRVSGDITFYEKVVD